MGAWPEFQACCWLVPLKTATVFIGICTLVLNLARIVGYVSAIALHLANEGREDSEQSEEALYDMVVFTWYVVISLCEAVIGAIILLAMKKAYLLRKTVSFMTVLWLLNLLISLVNASREAYLDAYINAISMLFSAYFILIVRSYHLKLEGRLGSIDSYSGQFSISENMVSPYNSMSRPPPPNYEEAMRHYVVTFPPDYFEVSGENVIERRDDNEERRNEAEVNNNSESRNRNNETIAVLPVDEQRTAHSRRLSRHLSLSEDSISSDELSHRRHSTQVTELILSSRNSNPKEKFISRRNSSSERPNSDKSLSNLSKDSVTEENINVSGTSVSVIGVNSVAS